MLGLIRASPGERLATAEARAGMRREHTEFGLPPRFCSMGVVAIGAYAVAHTGDGRNHCAEPLGVIGVFCLWCGAASGCQAVGEQSSPARTGSCQHGRASSLASWAPF